MQQTIVKIQITDEGRHQTGMRCHHIVFVDEAGFMLAPLVRKTWAPRGCTPVIKVSEPHARISVIGAITINPKRNHFSFYFHMLKDNANFHEDSVIRFIEGLRRKIRNPLVIIWDAILIHRGILVNDYLAKHSKITVRPFPPYAPELNPVDRVWGYVKYNRMANHCLPNLIELRRRVTTELRRVQKRTDLLESFLNSTGLTL